MDKPLNVVLLLAGGQGFRMHTDRPKQFVEVAGKPVIAHTLQVFQRHPEIDRVYVVCNPEWNEFVRAAARNGRISKLRALFPAGDTSIDSLRNGIAGLQAELERQNPAVLTHEAVRPLVTEEIISLNLRTFRTHGNAVTAVRSQEAYMVSPDGISSGECIPRELLHRAQTPITFSLDDLTEAFRRAKHVRINRTQSLYTLITEVFPLKKLYISPGSELNFKLTLPEDIETLKAILTYRKNLD